MNAGADVNMRTNDNRTPLFGAAMGGFTGTVKLLVEAVADVNAVDRLQNSLLHLASPSRLRCVKLLLQLGVKINISNALNHNALKRFIVRCGSVNMRWHINRHAVSTSVIFWGKPTAAHCTVGPWPPDLTSGLPRLAFYWPRLATKV